MPTYEYQCLKCNKVFEVQQSIKDEALKTHECGGEVKRLFALKGSGWYRTDYQHSDIGSTAS